MYTIKKDGKYVRDSKYIGNVGKQSSYTTDPQQAVKYPTYEEAKKNACGDEAIVKMTLEWM